MCHLSLNDMILLNKQNSFPVLKNVAYNKITEKNKNKMFLSWIADYLAHSH